MEGPSQRTLNAVGRLLTVENNVISTHNYALLQLPPPPPISPMELTMMCDLQTA